MKERVTGTIDAFVDVVDVATRRDPGVSRRAASFLDSQLRALGLGLLHG